MKHDLKLIFSFLLGIVGIVLSISNLMIVMFLPTTLYPKNLLEIIALKIYYIKPLTYPLFIGVIPLSLIGIFLALKSSQRKLAIFAIFFNLIGLVVSLFLAVLLFGLARGM